ncbi:MAG: YgaP family membrane protein [Devosia sp.]
MFKKNVGTIDRVVRVIIGLAAIGLFFYLPDVAWRWWLLIGVVPLVTGAVGTCPIYSVLGLSTCPVRGA